MVTLFFVSHISKVLQASETVSRIMPNPCPSIENSTREERLAYVRRRYECISNCDICGICASFGGKNPEEVLADYLDGKLEMRETLVRFRQQQRLR